jgi:hypothetical protein
MYDTRMAFHGHVDRKLGINCNRRPVYSQVEKYSVGQSASYAAYATTAPLRPPPFHPELGLGNK